MARNSAQAVARIKGWRKGDIVECHEGEPQRLGSIWVREKVVKPWFPGRWNW